jgi:hypothetical protein
LAIPYAVAEADNSTVSSLELLWRKIAFARGYLCLLVFDKTQRAGPTIITME